MASALPSRREFCAYRLGVKEKSGDEGSNLGGRAGNKVERGNFAETKTNGGDWRKANSLAYHENLFSLRNS